MSSKSSRSLPMSSKTLKKSPNEFENPQEAFQ
jgi:hypothetical protein